MLEGATREKFFLLLYKELVKKLFGQKAVVSGRDIFIPCVLRGVTTSSQVE